MIKILKDKFNLYLLNKDIIKFIKLIDEYLIHINHVLYEEVIERKYKINKIYNIKNYEVISLKSNPFFNDTFINVLNKQWKTKIFNFYYVKLYNKIDKKNIGKKLYNYLYKTYKTKNKSDFINFVKKLFINIEDYIQLKNNIIEEDEDIYDEVLNKEKELFFIISGKITFEN